MSDHGSRLGFFILGNFIGKSEATPVISSLYVLVPSFCRWSLEEFSWHTKTAGPFGDCLLLSHTNSQRTHRATELIKESRRVQVQGCLPAAHTTTGAASNMAL